jgi:hypothetical protein
MPQACNLAVVAALAVTATPLEGVGQTVSAPRPEPPFRLELRIGSRVPADRGPDGSAAVGVGILASVPLGGRLRALAIQLAADFVDLEDRIYEDPVFGLARDQSSLAILNPRLGLTIADSARFGVDLHVGPAVLISRTAFALERTPDSGAYDPLTRVWTPAVGEYFQSVCELTFFAPRCTSSGSVAGAIGVGARMLRVRRGALFVGADYSWHTNGRHLIVGTVGWIARRQP